MPWRYAIGQCHDWNWYFDLPNGWCAAVHDDSQMIAPRQITSYSISAICTHWIRQGNSTYQTLNEAKSAALALALLQEDDCGGPCSEYHYENSVTSTEKPVE